MSWQRIFQPEVLIFMIPIVAVVVGGIVAIVKLMIRHRERMIMIEHGLHPDYPPKELDGPSDPPLAE